MRTLFVTTYKRKRLSLLYEEGELSDLRIYEDASMVGGVYMGRVTNIVSNISAAFMDILPGVTAYYPLEEYRGEKKLVIGDMFPVQVVKDPLQKKQAMVSSRLSLTGEAVVVREADVIGVSNKILETETRKRLKALFTEICENFQEEHPDAPRYGGILRTMAAEISEDDLKEETIKLLCKLNEIETKAKYATLYSCLSQPTDALVSQIEAYLSRGELSIVCDRKNVCDSLASHFPELSVVCDTEEPGLAVRCNLSKILERATSRKVHLKSGAYLVIEPTEALLSIDVNTGKAIHGRDKDAFFLKVNKEAAEEIAKQLRFRNIGGMILVDFISMKRPGDTEELFHYMEKLVAKDYIKTIAVDVTKLGLMELTRKKVYRPLSDILAEEKTA